MKVDELDQFAGRFDWQLQGCQVTCWRLCEGWEAAVLGCPVSYHFPLTPLFSKLPGVFSSSFSTSTLFYCPQWNVTCRGCFGTCRSVRPWHFVELCVCPVPLLGTRAGSLVQRYQFWFRELMWSVLSCAAEEQKDYTATIDLHKGNWWE